MTRKPRLPTRQGAEKHVNTATNFDFGTTHRSGLGADFSLRASDLLPRWHALRVLGISHQERAPADLARAGDAGAQSLAALAAVPRLRGRQPIYDGKIPARRLRPRAVGAAADPADLRHARDRTSSVVPPDRREPRLSSRFRRLLCPPLSGVQPAVLSESLHRAADLEPSLVRGLSLGLHHGAGWRAGPVAGGRGLDR